MPCRSGEGEGGDGDGLEGVFMFLQTFYTSEGREGYGEFREPIGRAGARARGASGILGATNRTWQDQARGSTSLG